MSAIANSSKLVSCNVHAFISFEIVERARLDLYGYDRE